MASSILGTERIPGSISVSRSGVQLLINEDYEFLVESDDPNATRLGIIFETPGLPVVGLRYELNGLVCSQIDAKRRDDNFYFWDVTCSFESGIEDQKLPSSPGPSSDPYNPLEWVPVFKIGKFRSKNKIMTKDKDGVVIANSARTPFSPLPEETVQLCVYEFVQFEDPTLTLTEIEDRNGCVNSVSFTDAIVGTVGARECLLNVVGAELGFYGNYAAWRVAYEACRDPEKWDIEYYDIGPVYLDGGTTQKPFFDATNTIHYYGNLDTDGDKLAVGDAPLVKTFKRYTELDFKTFIRGLA